jgi:hypothetical protein
MSRVIVTYTHPEHGIGKVMLSEGDSWDSGVGDDGFDPERVSVEVKPDVGRRSDVWGG